MNSRKHVERFEVFRQYYASESFLKNLVLPSKPSLHHFRFQSFSSNRFYRIARTIKYKREMQILILKKEPKNVYFTPVKWLMPSNMRKVTDYMLSSPLFFDVDSKLSPIEGLNKAAQTATRVIEFIEIEYGRHPSWIVFSGRRGFHIYYWEWDDIPRRYPRASDRVSKFKETRRKIVKELLKAKIVVDYSVTTDPWRLLRVPGTLHGETGYIALKIDDIAQFRVEMASSRLTT